MGAQLGKLEVTRQDNLGNPIVGSTISVLAQGATIQSGGPNVFTVDDVGALSVGDTVTVYNADGTPTGAASRSITAINAAGTQITVGGPGFPGVTNNQRMVATLTALLTPAMYNDAQGNEFTAGTTLATDSNGYATCWTFDRPVDMLSQGGVSPLGTAADHMWFDVHPNKGTYEQEAGWVSATSVLRRIDLQRTVVAGLTVISYHRPGPDTEFWAVKFAADLLAAVPTHHVTGALIVDSGGITVTAGGVTITAGGFTVTAGSVSLPAGSLATAALAANAIHPASVKTLGGNSDVVITTSEVVRATTSYTPTSGNVGVLVTCNFPYTINGAVNTGGRVELRLYIGGTLKAVGLIGGSTGANEVFNNQGSISFDWIEPTMAASATTFEVREIRIDTAGSTTGTYKGTIYQGYMTIQEMKK